MEDARTVAYRLFSDCISKLFGSYVDEAPQVRPLADPEIRNPLDGLTHDFDRQLEMVSSSIGLGSDEMRCSIGLLAHVTTVQAVCEHDVENPTDWMGELANQLMGRMKNCLAEYGVVARMGMPVSVRGMQMGFTSPTSHQTAMCADLEAGRIVAVLHLEVGPGVTWQHDPNRAHVDEGSFCLF